MISKRYHVKAQILFFWGGGRGRQYKVCFSCHICQRKKKEKKKRNPTPDNHKKYVALRGISQRMQRQAFSSYTASLFDPEDVKHSKIKFWQFVKLKRKDSCGIAPMRKDCILISDSLGKANVLNRQYSSVFTPIKEEDIPSSPQPGLSLMPHRAYLC